MLILFLDRICTTVSLKPCINLSLFKRLNFNVRLVSSLTYCKNWVLFCSNNTEDYFFKFICWYYVSNSFTNCTPFLNRAWIKRQIKSLGSSWKSLYLVLHTDLFGTLHHYNYLNMTESMRTSPFTFMEEKYFTKTILHLPKILR